jgi:hypothetical protein
MTSTQAVRIAHLRRAFAIRRIGRPPKSSLFRQLRMARTSRRTGFIKSSRSTFRKLLIPRHPFLTVERMIHLFTEHGARLLST